MCEQIPPKEISASDSDNSLRNLQFEYAWRYFNFHAAQRTTMFNFFLVFSGFFVGACAKLLGAKEHELLLMALVFGAGITLIFILLERRNEELVHQAEDVLRYLEKNFLFKNVENPVKWPQRRYWFGCMKKGRPQKDYPLGILLAEDFKNKLIDPSVNRHGRWLPIIEFLLFLMYVLFILYLLCPPVRSFCMILENLLPR